MRVRRYWACVEVERRESRNDSIRARVWGGSDASEADALERAKARAADTDWDALAEQRRRPSNAHNYSYHRGVTPEHIVDEFLDASGSRYAAITVNRYGAQVLNTASLGFVDIDADRMNPKTLERVNELARETVQSRPREPVAGEPKRGILGRIAAFFAGSFVEEDVWVPVPTERVEAWVRAAPGRGVRAYRTAAGVRLILTQPPMDPASAETARTLEAFGADPAYAALCRAQESFRARLTPKPWRMREMHHDRRTIGYLDYADPSAEIADWIERYSDASASYSVCEFEGAWGAADPHDEHAAQLIKLHDEATGVGVDLPLA